MQTKVDEIEDNKDANALKMSPDGGDDDGNAQLLSKQDEIRRKQEQDKRKQLDKQTKDLIDNMKRTEIQ